MKLQLIHIISLRFLNYFLCVVRTGKKKTDNKSALSHILEYSGVPRWLSSKESTCQHGNRRDVGLIPGSRRSPGGGNGNSLQYSCLGNLTGQRNLVGCGPQGHKESDTTECTHTTPTHTGRKRDTTVKRQERTFQGDGNALYSD